MTHMFKDIRIRISPSLQRWLHLQAILFMITGLLLSLTARDTAMAASAGGGAFADDLVFKGKMLRKEGPVYRSPLKERAFSAASLSRPPKDGAFIFRLPRDFSAGAGPEGEWSRLTDGPWICYADYGAIAFRTRLKAPSSPGAHRYVWTFQAPGGAEANVMWEYKILSAGYARLLCAINGGTAISVYGGAPLSELDLSSGLSFLSLEQSLQDTVLEKHCAGLWKVTRHFEGREEGTDTFEFRMLAVRSASVERAPGMQEGGQKKEPPMMIFRAVVEALPYKTALSPSGWRPESLACRICGLREMKDGELLVHRSWKPSLQLRETDPKGGAVAAVEHQWNGIDDGESILPPEGRGRIVMQVAGRTKEGPVKSQFTGAPFTYAAMPRIVIRDRQGEMLADSMELSAPAGFSAPARGAEEASGLPASVTFVPRGDGVSLPPSGPSAGIRLTSKIFGKTLKKEEPIKISIQGLPEDWSACTLTVSSSFPGREELSFLLKREGRSGSCDTTLILTSEKTDSARSVLIGRKSESEKSFALIDLTYLEDTWMMKNILTGRGWHSAGEYYGKGSPQNPPLTPGAREFIRNCGYETLTLSCDAFSGIRAVMHVKNQAQLFYYGGHGWANSAIYLDGNYIYPEADVVEGDWNDGLKVVIFSSCSILDIGNFNRRSFTAFGKANQSPGIYWAKVAGPEVALLGYNWSTQEGKPPNAFDTRVIRRYINLASQYPPPVAWIYANIKEGDGVAPCAIYRHNYYYISSGSSAITVVPERNWRDASPPADAVRIAWPR